jgi:hypothetical protein
VSVGERIGAVNVSLDDRAFATSRVLCKDLGDEAVLLDLTTETYFGLNESGSRIWKLVTTLPTMRQALAIMLEEFEVAPDELERDMQALIEELVDRGLLRTENA